MKTAILTGATAGLGTLLLDEMVKQFPDVDRYVLIARRRDRLEALQEKYPGKCIVPLSLDLTDPSSFDTVAQWLAEHRPDVRMLVNNAGLGTLGDFIDMDCASQTRMVDLNVRALTALTNVTLPYMSRGGFVLNICSIASFCPNPRMTVYSSTKAYVLSFSKSLRYELKDRGINVLAACPGPMETEFFAVAGISKEKSRMFATLPYCDPAQVARNSLKAAAAGHAVYTDRAFFKFYRVVAKLVPHNLLLPLTKT
jgi:short-subunit dehydrogenase